MAITRTALGIIIGILLVIVVALAVVTVRASGSANELKATVVAFTGGGDCPTGYDCAPRGAAAPTVTVTTAPKPTATVVCPANLICTPKSSAKPSTSSAPSTAASAAPAGSTAPKPSGNGGTFVYPGAPGDLEAMPRWFIDDAQLGIWFHPVYGRVKFQNSNGYDGQYSWRNTIALLQKDGGDFIQFEGNDGRFVFRVNSAHSVATIAVLETSRWKSQFQGNTALPTALNVRSMPNTPVEILGSDGQVLATQNTSPGGDLLLVLPDDGVIIVRVVVNDPAQTFEVQYWFGPDDRPTANINRLDVRNFVLK